MELKVWVNGVVRVVCGLSLTTSCQDVVIALAQAIGQTGRYVLILKLRGIERQLVATDCPVQVIAQLGQQATEVRFILRRTGKALSDGPHVSSKDRRLLLHRHPQPTLFGHREPQKSLSFSLGSSIVPRRTRTSRAWSPSPRASPEPRATTVPFLNPADTVKAHLSNPSKEEAFRRILQQQEQLHDLETQLQDLECEIWEFERVSLLTPVPTHNLEEDLEVLEMRLRQTEAELLQGKYLEEQLRAELDQEQDMHRRRDMICSSVDDHSNRLQELQACSVRLGQDLHLEAHRQNSLHDTLQPNDTLFTLKQELQNRLQQGAKLNASLFEKEKELQAMKATLENRYQLIEELNKELRQCKLQQFIQQTGVTSAPPNDVPQGNQLHPLPLYAQYISNAYAGILEDDLAEAVSVCYAFGRHEHDR